MRMTLRHVLAAVTLTATASCGDDDSATPPTTAHEPQSRHILTLSANADTIPEATSRSLTARVMDHSGIVKPVTISWTSTDTSVLTVSDGRMMAIRQGSASVIASTAGAADTATIVVTDNGLMLDVQPGAASVAIGDTVNFVATLRTRTGEVIDVGPVTWTSSDTTAGHLTSSGTLRARREGEVAILAEAFGRRGTSTVRIFRSPARTVTIAPSTASVPRGATLELGATLRDENGRLVDGNVSWESSNHSTATVSGNGTVTGHQVGSVVITASADGRTGRATVKVVSPVASSLTLILPSTTLLVGATMQISVSAASDSVGSLLVGKSVKWLSDNPAVATVTAGGTVTGVAEGTVNVSAIVGNEVAQQRIAVTGSRGALIRVTPASPSVAVGRSSQLVAQVFDEAGREIPGQAITWSSANPQAAAISSTGLLTGVAPGTSVITATSGAASETVNVSVVWVPVASVKVSPAVVTLDLGSQMGLSAQAADAGGNVLSGRPLTWTSQQPNVATVSNAGMVMAVGTGTATITAIVEGESSNAVVTVKPASVAVEKVAIRVPSRDLTVGQSVQTAVIVSDSSGRTLTGQTITYTSENSSVVTVSATGLVKAVGAGTTRIRVTSGGVTATETFRVASSTTAVSSISVSPSSAILTVGQTVQASAAGTDAQGGSVTEATYTWTTSNVAVASVSSSGLVSAVGAGTATITAASSGATGRMTVSVSSALTPASTTASAELPRIFLNYSFPAKTGQTISVPAGGNLQNALNSARRGDEIVLAAGATYTGNFTLPAKSGSASNGWITIRSSKLSSFPTMGTRAHASQASLMPKIVTPNTGPAIRLAAGASGWWIAGVEVTVSASVTTQNYGLVFLGESGGLQKSLSSVPQDIVLDRMYIHGQSKTQLSRCVALNSGRTQISDSYIVECHGKGFDSQAIAGWNGPGPYKIVNNALFGAGENVMFGGADPGISGLVPSDIEIRRNYIYTPTAWIGVWTKKNLFETKNAARVLVEANVFDGSWADGQTGWAVILKSANQSGGCRWCRTTDVTFRRNLIRNAGAGINVAPRGDNTATDTTTRRVVISETVLESIGVSPFNGDRRGFQLLANTHYVTIERSVLSGSLQAAIMLDKSPGSSYPQFRDNVLARGQYGVIATGAGPGTASLNQGAPGYTWSNMTMVGSPYGAYPTGTAWVSAETALASQIRAAVASATNGVIIR